MAAPSRARRFAPLKSDAPASDKSVPLQGVVFDMDGTLCEPQNYMFAEMRAALGIQKPTDILDHINSLPVAEQQTGFNAIQEIEKRAMAAQKAQPGLLQLMEYLDSRGIRKAICTRNFDLPVTHLLEKFLSTQLFEPVLTRAFKPPKPDPAGILHIAEQWGVSKGTDNELPLIMVGDSIDDMTAGRKAGAATILLRNSENADLASHDHTDLHIERLDDLIAILEDGFIGQDRRAS